MPKNTKKSKKSLISRLNSMSVIRSRKFFIFAAVLVIGTVVLIRSLAETTISLDPSDVIAAYFTNDSINVKDNLATGKVTFNSIPTYYVVTADGTMLCDDGNPNSTASAGKLNKGELKSLTKDVKSSGLETVPNSIKGSEKATVDGEVYVLAGEGVLKSVVVNGKVSKPGQLVSMKNKMLNACKKFAKSETKRGVKKITIPNQARSSALLPIPTRLVQILVPKAYANAPNETLDTAFADSQFNKVNAYRAAHGIRQLKRMDCLNNYATGHALDEAQKDTIFHSTSLYADLGASCQSSGMVYYAANPGKPAPYNNWQGLGENAGVTTNTGNLDADSNTMFQAYLASPHHYASIVDGGFACGGSSAYLSLDDNAIYHSIEFASWAASGCNQ